MNTTKTSKLFNVLTTVALALGLSVSLSACQVQDEKKNTQETESVILKRFHARPGFEPAELSEAMEDENFLVDVEIKDAANATVKIENRTNKSLAVRMPLAYSLVPATADEEPNAGFVGGFGRDVGGGVFGGRHENDGSGGGILCRPAVLNIPQGCSGELQLKIFYPGISEPDLLALEDCKLASINKLSKDKKIFDMCRWLANGGISQEDAQARAIERAKLHNDDSK